MPILAWIIKGVALVLMCLAFFLCVNTMLHTSVQGGDLMTSTVPTVLSMLTAGISFVMSVAAYVLAKKIEHKFG